MKIGDGSKARFWEDWWCGEAPLCFLFPCCIIWQALKGLGLQTFGWFRGPGKDGTSALEVTFMIGNWRRCKVSLVNSQSISPNLSDRIWWKETKNGSFSVKTCFDLLEGGRK